MYVTRMKAYEGDEDYIFVSYAHKDADFVLPIIDNLHELGYRVWFDEGIEASAEWPEYIEDHMNRCSAVLAFVTDNFVESANCRKEITYALNSGKQLLYVTPEKVELARGLRLQLADQQCIDLSNMTTQRFYQKLADTEVMEDCRWKAPDGTIIKPHKKRRKKKKAEWTPRRAISTIIVSFAVGVIAIVVLALIMSDSDANQASQKLEDSQPTETAHEWVDAGDGVMYCKLCGVQTGSMEETRILTGDWAPSRVHIQDSDSGVYVPVAVVENCTAMTVSVHITSVSGDPYGTYYLYAREPDNTWDVIAQFELTDEATKNTVNYDFDFDDPVTFTGLSIVLADTGRKYNIDYEVDYKGVIINKAD